MFSSSDYDNYGDIPNDDDDDENEDVRDDGFRMTKMITYNSYI